MATSNDSVRKTLGIVKVILDAKCGDVWEGIESIEITDKDSGDILIKMTGQQAYWYCKFENINLSLD